MSMDVFRKHQLNIAKKTLRLSNVGVLVMGGMTKEDAREFLKSIGWSSERIKNWDDK